MKKLSTDQLVKQLEMNQTGKIPALYEGTSWRSSYSRSDKHIKDYNAKNSHKSWMSIHTNAVHGGLKGDMRGIYDYKYKLIETFKDNLTRAVDEGRRQLEMEDLQTRGKIICCNSKLDFIQPFKTHLQVNTGNKNVAPGKVETRKVHFNMEDQGNKETKTVKTSNKDRQKDKDSQDMPEDRQKRKTPDYKEDRLESEMKRQKLADLDNSIQFRKNVNRCSTPVAESRRKRTNEEAELSSAQPDLDSYHYKEKRVKTKS